MSAHLLVLNSAEGVLQLVLARREDAAGPWAPLLYDALPAASQGAELLAPRLRLCLERLELLPRALTHIAAVRGPGSFTGLRLALATAAGLARAVGAMQAGLDYLPLLAASAFLRLGRQAPELWVLTHARRDLVHVQSFGLKDDASSGPCPTASGPVLVLRPEEALRLAAARARDKSAALLGSGLDKNRLFFEEATEALRANGRSAPLLLGPEQALPLPEALLAVASGAGFGPEDIEPFYARPCDAEENLAHIAAGLGLDPASARRRLDELTGKTP